MGNFDQGPGRNIHFCLITTGLNLDPCHGCYAREINFYLKQVIEQRADIHYENNTIREVFDIDASGILPGYSSNPRTIYQFLFGVVEHSYAWTEETLAKAIDETPFPQKMKPKFDVLSIDFVQSIEDGMTLYQNQFIGSSDVWVEYQTFYYSACLPGLGDGDPGDIWLSSNGSVLELYIKDVFRWVPLYDSIKSKTPAGQLFIQDSTPLNQTNSFWLDTTGINIRKFSTAINMWDVPPTNIAVQPTAPTGFTDGDVWIRPLKGAMQFFEYNASESRFVRSNVSEFPVQDRNTNSAFVGTIGSENFDITCGDEALKGGPLVTGATDLKVKKDGVLIQSAVNCINFIGPDLDVTAPGPNAVDVEHLPYTSLPELPSAPSPDTDTGKVFTLDVGGVTELFYIDDSGDVIQITNDGVIQRNIFLIISTPSAVSGQTVFSVPSTAKAVLSLKINGVDTTAFTFSSPSVTYNPVVGGYDVESGDVVSVLYYGS